MKVYLAGIKVEPRFVYVNDEDEVLPQGKGLELQYATLTEFAAQAVGQVREAWEQLRTSILADPNPGQFTP